MKPCEGTGNRWELDVVLDTSHVITCLDWSVHSEFIINKRHTHRLKSMCVDLLLSAGKDIIVWKFDTIWQVFCKKTPSGDIQLAKFEPKSNRFATMSEVSK